MCPPRLTRWVRPVTFRGWGSCLSFAELDAEGGFEGFVGKRHTQMPIDMGVGAFAVRLIYMAFAMRLRWDKAHKSRIEKDAKKISHHLRPGHVKGVLGVTLTSI